MWILRIHASQCSYGVSKVRDLAPGLVHSGVVQLLNHVQLFVIPWTVAHQASLSFTISQSLLRFMFTELVILSVSSSATPFSFCLQSFPASGSFPMIWLFTSSGQSISGDCSHEIKRHLLLGRKVMTNLDNILKSRDITLSTKV